MRSRSAVLDLELVGRLAAAVPVPLVLHGSSGVPIEMLAEAVRAGIRKVNVGTALNIAYTGALRDGLRGDGERTGTGPRSFLREARGAISLVVAELVGALGRPGARRDGLVQRGEETARGSLSRRRAGLGVLDRRASALTAADLCVHERGSTPFRRRRHGSLAR